MLAPSEVNPFFSLICDLIMLLLLVVPVFSWLILFLVFKYSIWYIVFKNMDICTQRWGLIKQTLGYPPPNLATQISIPWNKIELPPQIPFVYTSFFHLLHLCVCIENLNVKENLYKKIGSTYFLLFLCLSYL